VAPVTAPAWLPTPSQHLLVVAIALLVYVVNARARRERRPPASAIAWVMGLALLPYLMLPLYLAFGQRKLSATRSAGGVAAGSGPDWSAALLAGFGIEPAAPARTRFHADGAQSETALRELIEGARQSLDVCTFLIGNDALGRGILSGLAARAREGVQVRLLYDGLGAWGAPRGALEELRSAGARIAVFRPLLALRANGPRNLRNHRKFVIADGSRLWAGGRNLATEYFGGDGEPPWLDLSFDLQGEVAAQALRQFGQDWHSATREHPTLPPPATAPQSAGRGDSLAQFLPSGPDQVEDNAQALLITAAFRARTRLLAVTPYFVPDGALQNALRLAARRGVQVTLVIPLVSNHRLADFVRARPLRELSDAGARVLLLPRMSHAKAVVVDDDLSLCGSINLDSRSLLLNYECAVVFHGGREAQWLAAWIEARAQESSPFIATPPGLLRDLAEGALLAVAFQV